MSNTIGANGEVSPAPPAAQQALDAVIARWNRAAESWDADELAALYTQDALMFGGRPGLAIGVPGMREYFQSYVGSLASAQLELVDQYVLELAPQTYLAQGFGVFKFRLVDGRHTGTTMRTTLVIARENGSHLIRQHHFSTIPDRPPID